MKATSLLALLGLALLAGCSLLTSYEGYSDEYGSAAAGGGAGPAGVDQCAPLPYDSPSWVLQGFAGNLASVYFQLTDAKPNEDGAIWWKTPATFDEFELSFEFRISPQITIHSADGFAFTWLNSTTPPAAQTIPGPNFGLPAIPGWALVFDTRVTNGTFAQSEPIELVDGTASGLSNSNALTGNIIKTGAVHIGSDWAAIRLTLHDKTITVSYGGAVLYVQTVSNYQPYAGVWGFTASTDSPDSQQSAIRNIRMYFPGGGGCVK